MPVESHPGWIIVVDVAISRARIHLSMPTLLGARTGSASLICVEIYPGPITTACTSPTSVACLRGSAGASVYAKVLVRATWSALALK